MRLASLALIALPLAVACGGDDEAVPDAGGAPDGSSIADAGGTPDAEPFVCEPAEPGEPGGACEEDPDCASSEEAGDGLCLDENSGSITGPEEGYCSRVAADSEGPCPDGSVALDIEPGEQEFFVCLPTCCEGTACPEGQLCQDLFFGARLESEVCIPGNGDAADGDSCGSIIDCNESSLCRDDPIVFPGGFCQKIGCDVGDDSTCNGGRCLDFDGVGGGPPSCVPSCQEDSDCRETEGYFCRDLTDEGYGKFCDHREVGEPCSANTDCGTDPPWVCRTEAEFPGGYCTLGATCPETSCPIRSFCHEPDEGDAFCAGQCFPDDPEPCREGYDCIELVPAQGQQDAKFGCVPAEA